VRRAAIPPSELEEAVERRVAERLAALVLTNAELRRQTERDEFVEHTLRVQRDLARAFAMSADSGTAVARVLDIFVALNGVDYCCIYLCDPETGAYRLSGQRGLLDGWQDRLVEFAATSPQAGVLRVSTPLYTTSAHLRKELHLPPQEQVVPDEVRSLGILPVFYQREPVAGIVVGSRDSDRLNAKSAAALELSAAQIGGELAATVQLDRSRAQSAQLRALLEASHAMASTLDYDEVLSVVADQICEVGDADVCEIWEYVEKDGICALRGLCERHPRPGHRELLMGRPFTRADLPGEYRAIESERTVECVVSDPGIGDDILANMALWGEKAWLTVPLIYNGQLLGMINLVQREKERRYRADERRLVEGLAQRAAAAMSNAKLYRGLEERSQRLAALVQAGRQITMSIVLEDVLRAVAENAATALGSQECAIWEYDRERDVLITRSAFARGELAAPRTVGSTYRLDDYPRDRQLLASDQVVEEHASDPPTDTASRESMVALGEKTCLSIPLRFNNEPVGMLMLVEKESERYFAPEERELARALGDHAAAAIHNAQLYRRLELQNQRLASLLDSSRSITSSIDYDEVLHLITRKAAEALDAANCLIHEFDPVHGLLISRADHYPAGSGPLGRDTTGETYPLRDRPFELAVMRAGRPVVQHANDPSVDAESRADMTEFGEKSRLFAPITFEGELLGLLQVIETRCHREFSEEEIRIASGLVEQAAVALNNARLHRRIAEQAITDGLTGLYNHRYFYELLERSLAEGSDEAAPLSLLMIDLDDFKQLNDTYGHVAGDEVLRAVAAIISAQIRGGVDRAARFGGEEFAVIVPHRSQPAPEDDDPEEEARRVAERIRAAMEAARFAVHGAEARLTVSIGMATSPSAATTMDRLVARADAALYDAKRAGKNRLAVYEP
jgi:diguanylate cyclase (GGDEF)-like protein